LTIVGVIVVLAVLIAAMIFVATPRSGGEEASSWNYQVGDFLEYGFNKSESGRLFVGNFMWRVTSVTAAGATFNTTYTDQAGSLPSYKVFVPRNGTVPPVFTNPGYNMSNPDPSYNFSRIGVETLSTKWGLRSAVHYRLFLESEYPYPEMKEYWVRNEVVMKAVLSINTLVTTIVLWNTNLAQIINP
jgi:hypothetical protein